MSDIKRGSSSGASVDDKNADLESPVVSKQLSDIETRDPTDLPPVPFKTQFKIVRALDSLSFRPDASRMCASSVSSCSSMPCPWLIA